MVQQLIRSTEVQLDIAVGHAARKPGAGLEGVSQQPVDPRPSHLDGPNGADQFHRQQAPIGCDRRRKP